MRSRVNIRHFGIPVIFLHFTKMVKLMYISMCVVMFSLLAMTRGEAEKQDSDTVDQEKVDYAKGSVCQYCDYCKFCVLCDEQCPCEIGPGRPACNMCKYCTYCKFCTICDTVCQPGGLIDKVTGALVSSLPTFSQDDVDADIAGVKDHIRKKREEL